MIDRPASSPLRLDIDPAVALKLANEYVIATGAAQADVIASEKISLNSTATLLSTSLYIRVMAFEMALDDPEVRAILIQLRDQDRTEEVFAVAASAPLDPGIGQMPSFLPEFRDRIEDLVFQKP